MKDILAFSVLGVKGGVSPSGIRVPNKTFGGSPVEKENIRTMSHHL